MAMRTKLHRLTLRFLQHPTYGLGAALFAVVIGVVAEYVYDIVNNNSPSVGMTATYTPFATESNSHRSGCPLQIKSANYSKSQLQFESVAEGSGGNIQSNLLRFSLRSNSNDTCADGVVSVIDGLYIYKKRQCDHVSPLYKATLSYPGPDGEDCIANDKELEMLH